MELWIRSQDKMKLVKANNIIAREVGNLYWIFNDENVIGQYIKTRGLEVLDTIQSLLDGTWIAKNKPNVTASDIFPIIFYEMP